MLDTKGGLHLLDARDVAEIVIHKPSPMPADYATRLKPGEIQNLLAFLSRQAMRPETPEERAERERELLRQRRN